MASDDSFGMLRDLMWVEHPPGTHLSQSSTPGRRSALARDEDNVLITHAGLLPAEGVFEAEDVIKIVAAVAAVGVTVGVVAMKAAPHVKNRFNDLKSKLSRKADVEADDSQGGP